VEAADAGREEVVEEGSFFAAPRNGVAVRVMAFTPNDFWQDTSSSIDKPVAYLQHCEAGLSGKCHFLAV